MHNYFEPLIPWPARDQRTKPVPQDKKSPIPIGPTDV
jgi:hypothetical protein